MNGKNVIFRRINGRIIPIKLKNTKSKREEIKAKKGAAVSGGLLGLGFGVKLSESKIKRKVGELSDRAYEKIKPDRFIGGDIKFRYLRPDRNNLKAALKINNLSKRFDKMARIVPRVSMGLFAGSLGMAIYSLIKTKNAIKLKNK